MDAWGLKLLCKNPRWRSNSLSVIEVPKGVDSGDIVKFAFAKYNLSLGVGLSEVAGKVFRIGHLGNMDEVSAHCLHLANFYVFLFRPLYIASVKQLVQCGNLGEEIHTNSLHPTLLSE